MHSNQRARCAGRWMSIRRICTDGSHATIDLLLHRIAFRIRQARRKPRLRNRPEHLLCKRCDRVLSLPPLPAGKGHSDVDQFGCLDADCQPVDLSLPTHLTKLAGQLDQRRQPVGHPTEDRESTRIRLSRTADLREAIERNGRSSAAHRAFPSPLSRYETQIGRVRSDQVRSERAAVDVVVRATIAGRKGHSI